MQQCLYQFLWFKNNFLAMLSVWPFTLYSASGLGSTIEKHHHQSPKNSFSLKNMVEASVERHAMSHWKIKYYSKQKTVLRYVSKMHQFFYILVWIVIQHKFGPIWQFKPRYKKICAFFRHVVEQFSQNSQIRKIIFVHQNCVKNVAIVSMIS